MGELGEGVLVKKVLEANGILFGIPVHIKGTDALIHLFIERLYPFMWSNRLNGLPIAVITCASNQGWHLLAYKDMCKWAFTFKMRWIDGLPVHTSLMNEYLPKAKELGGKLARESLIDENCRRKMSEEEAWLYYLDKPFNPLEIHFENLTNGTFNVDESLIERVYKNRLFKERKANELLRLARAEFIKSFTHYLRGDFNASLKSLIKASSYWTHATWYEYVEKIVGTPPPKTYKPLI